MADKMKMVDEITSMEEDFAKWYTDVCVKAELVDYSSVKGCLVIRPYGYAIWEAIQRDLDRRFKESGHENVYMPMFIPESLLEKEKNHVDGFAPEVAWVTHGGDTELTERLCVRPTSETLFCEHYSNIIHSHRDLPKKYNQWCSVVRWEKTTRPFLRSREFLWQEGHTIHESEAEARTETLQMLDIYANFCSEMLAMPVIKGQKTEKEKFSGAVDTYTIEAMMHDGRALQSGTSHYFGDGFAKAFNITYAGKDNTLQYPFQTSWGMSTRLIGGLIMCHGDNEGLVLPPKIAPIQLIIIPIMAKKPGVNEKAAEIKASLESQFRVSIDDSDNSPGWKFSQSEMQGIPLRLEIGPRDIEHNQCVLVRRDTREKITCDIDKLSDTVGQLLNEIHAALLHTAQSRINNMTSIAHNMEEITLNAETKPGFIKAMWCGDAACEERIKEQAQLSSRCIPFSDEVVDDKCVCCGKPASKMVYWGKQY